MKNILKMISISMILLGTANAADKFSNITEDYLTTKASINVRATIAKDPQTAQNVLQILTKDSNEQVRIFAKQNLK